MRVAWHVEMWNPERKRWETCTGCGLAREDGRLMLNAWKARSRNWRFRLVKYVPADSRR